MAPQALQTNALDDLICRLRPLRQQKGAVVLKTELIQRVADLNPHLRASDAEKIVNTIFEEMIAAMARGDRVELRGIGAFTVRVRRGRPGRNLRTGRVAGWSPGKMIHAHLTPQSTQLLSGPFRASVLRPQLPSNSQRMCLLLALRFARPSRAPAPRRPRTQRDHLPSATLFDSGFPKSWALSRQCASIPFGNSTTRW